MIMEDNNDFVTLTISGSGERKKLYTFAAVA
jgi:hypothetical protein